MLFSQARGAAVVLFFEMLQVIFRIFLNLVWAVNVMLVRALGENNSTQLNSEMNLWKSSPSTTQE